MPRNRPEKSRGLREHDKKMQQGYATASPTLPREDGVSQAEVDQQGNRRTDLPERGLNESIINTAQSIILLLDNQGRILRVNPYFEKLTGWTAEDIQGRDWFETFLPERDRGPIRQLFQRAFVGEATRGNVNPILTKQGEERFIEWHDARLSNADGEFVGLVCIGQDVTERQQAERALRESEHRLRLAQQAARIGVWEWDIENETVSWDPTQFEICGVDLATKIHLNTFLDLVHPEDLPELKRLVSDVLEKGAEYNTEFRIVRPDGAVRWLAGKGSAIRREDNAPLRMIGVNYDITERKQAEDHLQESEERMSLAVRATQDAIWDYDLVRGTVWWNERYNELFGKRPPETKDGVDWWIGRIHPEDRQRVIDSFHAAIEGDTEFWEAEYQYRQASGEYAHAIDRGYIIRDPQGKATRILGAMTDITERKRTEEALYERKERLLAVLNTAADAIITINLRGIIDKVNPATEQMFGYSQEELLGENVKILMPPPFCDEYDQYLSSYRERGEGRVTNFRREVVGRRKDGAIFPIDLAVSQVDHLGLYTAVLRDISDRRELEKQVIEVAAEESRRIGSELHDNIQQQLTGLGLLAASLAEGLDRKSVPEAQSAQRLAEGIQQTTEQVHLLSRGLVPVEVEGEGLRSALTELAARVNQQYGIHCDFHCENFIKVNDNFLAKHLYRITQEAITNAVKHGRAKQIEISLSELNGNLTLQIVDNGIGIGDKRKAGPGMGLRIMNYRAGLIGATLRIAPREQGGTLVSCMVLTRRVRDDELEDGDQQDIQTNPRGG